MYMLLILPNLLAAMLVSLTVSLSLRPASLCRLQNKTAVLVALIHY